MFRSSLTSLVPEGAVHPGFVADPAEVRTFLGKVFTYMAMALVISGGIAYWFGHDMAMLAYLVDFNTGSRPFWAGWCCSRRSPWCS